MWARAFTKLYNVPVHCKSFQYEPEEREMNQFQKLYEVNCYSGIPLSNKKITVISL